MRILIVHNRYQQRGGEDAVFEAESQLLRRFGEDVQVYERSNVELKDYDVLQKMNFLFEINWSKKTYADIKRILKGFRPDVVHVHNIFYMISPSIYNACQEEGVPVVQSLHNFRLRCANGLFFRNNRVCEKCLDGSLWWGVWYRCYKNSSFMTALTVRLLDHYWRNRTWQEKVTYYLTATEFTRSKYIKAGISAGKIIVKSNFFDHSPLASQGDSQGYALYVGRLSHEKGVKVLLKAWKSLLEFPLKIMGDGPLMDELKAYAAKENLKLVEFLGYVPHQDYEAYLRNAKFVVVPSLCYENFPRIVAEAYAYGKPVLASRIGSFIELVRDNETGFLFEAGNSEDLLKKVHYFIDQENSVGKISRGARQEYESKYAPKDNYTDLKKIYEQAIHQYGHH